MKRLVIMLMTAAIILSAGVVMAATDTSSLNVLANCIDVCRI